MCVWLPSANTGLEHTAMGRAGSKGSSGSGLTLGSQCLLKEMCSTGSHGKGARSV